MTDNSIQVFSSEEFGDLRTLVGEDGEPWFVAKDVCDAIGIATNHIRETLDDDEVANLPNPEVRGRDPLIVSEPGLYSLILKSRKPEAKAFKRWVTHEVIPSIRKHGGYMVAKPDDTPEEIMARAVLIANDTISRQKARIAELEPKALFADAVAASDGTCLVGEFAKMATQACEEAGHPECKVGQNRMFDWLRSRGYLGNVGGNRNVPTQRFLEMGIFRIKETAITHSDGHVTLNRTTKVTGKGQRYLLDKFMEERRSEWADEA